MQMNELLPCPFCGGEAEMLTAESMNGGYLFGIMCNDCRSRGDVYDTEAEAIAAWNSRAELGSKPPYDELLRCLENDWNIRASWDGLRKFWSIELTEEGVRLRDAELNSRAERTCKIEHIKGGAMYDVWCCSACGYEYAESVSETSVVQNYCPNCGAKIIGG